MVLEMECRGEPIEYSGHYLQVENSGSDTGPKYVEMSSELTKRGEF